MSVRSILFIVGTIAILHGCASDNFEDMHPNIYCDTTGVITYENGIKQILAASCGSGDITCHKTGNVDDVNLDNYFDTRDLSENGDLAGSILHQDGFEPMPKTGTLDPCDLNKILAWISRGNPEN